MRLVIVTRKVKTEIFIRKRVQHTAIVFGRQVYESNLILNAIKLYGTDQRECIHLSPRLHYKVMHSGGRINSGVIVQFDTGDRFTDLIVKIGYQVFYAGIGF